MVSDLLWCVIVYCTMLLCDSLLLYSKLITHFGAIQHTTSCKFWCPVQPIMKSIPLVVCVCVWLTTVYSLIWYGMSCLFSLAECVRESLCVCVCVWASQCVTTVVGCYVTALLSSSLPRGGMMLASGEISHYHMPHPLQNHLLKVLISCWWRWLGLIDRCLPHPLLICNLIAIWITWASSFTESACLVEVLEASSLSQSLR